MIKDTGIEIENSKLTPNHLADIVRLVQDSIVSSTGAKQIVGECLENRRKGWRYRRTRRSETGERSGAFEPAIEKVVAANPENVAAYRAGKEKLLGFFVGQVMKETGGKANPGLIQELVMKKLKR